MNWFIIEQHFDAQLYPYHLYMDLYSSGSEEVIGRNLNHICIFYENGNFTQIFEKQDWKEHGEASVKKISVEAKQIAGKARIGIAELFEAGQAIKTANLNKLSNKELAELVKNFNEAFISAAKWGIIFPAAEYENYLISKYIKTLIAQKAEELKKDVNAEDAFQAIIYWPEGTYVSKEKEDLLKLLPLKENIETALKKHVEKYKWISFGFQGPELDYEYFKKALDDARKGGETLESIERHETEMLRKKVSYLDLLEIKDDEREYLASLAELNFLKALRKDAEFHGNYALSFIFKELAKRFSIPLTYSRMLLADEILDALIHENLDRDELARRSKKFVLLYENAKRSLYSGEKAEQFRKFIPHEEVPDISELKGDVACKGKVTGIVKVVHGKSDYDKFNEGDVLVSVATNPNMVQLMKKACAIVTDIGGITCHAAIVSRELKKPCVIGTKIATKALRDGDKVEVDAENGIVKKLS